MPFEPRPFRSKTATVHLTDAEYELLSREAKRAGLGISDYIRETLGRRLKPLAKAPTEGDRKQLAESLLPK